MKTNINERIINKKYTINFITMVTQAIKFEELITESLDKKDPNYLEKIRDRIKYTSVWNHRVKSLIEHNVIISDNDEIRIDESSNLIANMQHSLFKNGKHFNYDQALLILFGLNHLVLEKVPHLYSWKSFTMLNYSTLKRSHNKKDLNLDRQKEADWEIRNKNIYFAHGVNYLNEIESLIEGSPQNIVLKESAYFINGKITSENLLKLAKDNGFFIEPKTTHKSTTKKDKNVKEVEKALLEYLPTLDKKTNKNALVFHRDHDSFSQQFNFRRSTLSTHLTALITLEWWQKQKQKTQDNIKKPKK